MSTSALGIPSARWTATVFLNGSNIFSARGYFTAESAMRNVLAQMTSPHWNAATRFDITIAREEERSAADEGISHQ